VHPSARHVEVVSKRPQLPQVQPERSSLFFSGVLEFKSQTRRDNSLKVSPEPTFVDQLQGSKSEIPLFLGRMSFCRLRLYGVELMYSFKLSAYVSVNSSVGKELRTLEHDLQTIGQKFNAVPPPSSLSVLLLTPNIGG